MWCSDWRTQSFPLLHDKRTIKFIIHCSNTHSNYQRINQSATSSPEPPAAWSSSPKSTTAAWYLQVYSGPFQSGNPAGRTFGFFRSVSFDRVLLLNWLGSIPPLPPNVKDWPVSFAMQAACPFTEARFFTLQIPHTKQMHKHLHRYTQRRYGFAHCACDILTEGPNPSHDPYQAIIEYSHSHCSIKSPLPNGASARKRQTLMSKIPLKTDTMFWGLNLHVHVAMDCHIRKALHMSLAVWC